MILRLGMVIISAKIQVLECLATLETNLPLKLNFTLRLVDFCVSLKFKVFFSLELGVIFQVLALNRVSVFIFFILK